MCPGRLDDIRRSRSRSRTRAQRAAESPLASTRARAAVRRPLTERPSGANLSRAARARRCDACQGAGIGPTSLGGSSASSLSSCLRPAHDVDRDLDEVGRVGLDRRSARPSTHRQVASLRLRRQEQDRLAARVADFQRRESARLCLQLDRGTRSGATPPARAPVPAGRRPIAGIDVERRAEHAGRHRRNTRRRPFPLPPVHAAIGFCSSSRISALPVAERRAKIRAGLRRPASRAARLRRRASSIADRAGKRVRRSASPGARASCSS